MNEPIPSYEGKVFMIEDNEAIVRNPNNLSQASRYKAGDTIPSGNKVGDPKIVPLMTEIKVTGVRTRGNRNVYVFAEPATPDPLISSGWTRCTNLAGQFINGLVDFAPAKWDLEPHGNNYTVTDNNALIRNGSPNYKSQRTKIPAGTYVVVTARSKDTDPKARFVRVSEGKFNDFKITAVKPLGWTAASNLAAGWSPIFTTDAWVSEIGPNACWRKGRFIGAKVLVNIVGTGGQMQQITLGSLPAYFNLKNGAAKKNLNLSITSGFRTFAKQKRLRDLFENGKGNLAARPGGSNHQHGQALDLNTRGFDGDPIYDWLRTNGPRHGFIRTVSGEHWHWEHRPDAAIQHVAKGTFKLARVTK